MFRLPAPSLSLKSRLVLGSSAMLIPLVGLALVGYLLFDRTVRSLDHAVDGVISELRPVLELQNLVLRAAMPANDYLLHGDRTESEHFAVIADRLDQNFTNALIQFRQNGPRRELIESARRDWEQARSKSRYLLALRFPVKDPRALQEMEDMDRLLDLANAKLERAYTLSQQAITDSRDRVRRIALRVKLLIATAFAVGAFMAAVAAVLLVRAVLIPVRELAESASRIEAGELSHRATVAGDDELGRLGRRFNSMADRLERLAGRDSLTGLHNRREFERRIKDEIQRTDRYGGEVSLLMLDIDHFKSVNDRYGHPAGDRVLQVLAQTLNGTLRPTDQSARYGGEEFAIILPQTGADSAMHLAERLRQRIEALPMRLEDGTTLAITVSIGVAGYPADAGSPTRLVSAADQALYRAKAEGRNRVCHGSGEN